MAKAGSADWAELAVVYRKLELAIERRRLDVVPWRGIEKPGKRRASLFMTLISRLPIRPIFARCGRRALIFLNGGQGS